jgi:hypothetical protein
VAQPRILLVETVEASPLERIVFDVATTPLLLAVFLRMARLGRERGEAPVLCEREVHLVAIRIVETCADDRRLEIVVADHEPDPAQVAECPLMQAKERFGTLIPHRLLVAVARVSERHAKHPRTTPLAHLCFERRCAAKEVDLRLSPGRAVKDPDRSPPHRERADEPFHRFIAGSVAKLVDQVLPDPLEAEARVKFLGDRGAIRGGFGSRSFPRRAREHFGRVCIGAGEHFGAFGSSTPSDASAVGGSSDCEPENTLAAFARRARSYRPTVSRRTPVSA